MKEIKAIIHPHMLEAVLNALHELPRFPGLTIVDAIGEGRGAGKGHAYEPDIDELFGTKHKLIEIVCGDDIAESMAETIRKAAHTGRRGDGIIVITDVAQVIRIRSAERQEKAL